MAIFSFSSAQISFHLCDRPCASETCFAFCRDRCRSSFRLCPTCLPSPTRDARPPSFSRHAFRILSRAINGSAAFFATIGGGAVIVLVHRLLALVAYYSHGFGVLIKGRPDMIIHDGDLILPSMRRNHISKHDVEEDLRLEARTEDLKTSASATSSAAATSASSRRKNNCRASVSDAAGPASARNALQKGVGVSC